MELEWLGFGIHRGAGSQYGMGTRHLDHGERVHRRPGTCDIGLNEVARDTVVILPEHGQLLPASPRLLADLGEAQARLADEGAKLDQLQRELRAREERAAHLRDSLERQAESFRQSLRGRRDIDLMREARKVGLP